MCGIFAIFSLNNEVSKKSLTNAIESLYHRGPDNRNIWLSDNQRVGLAHARLSIIDLHTGEQPISNNNKDCHIIANGEFYDFELIRSNLQKQGHIFKTSSDSEIALHLYKQKGLNCLADLRGEFAFCLFDEPNQTLIAARDRFGINPLYYAEYNGQLYIGSEIKSLIAAGVPSVWDKNSYFSRAFIYRDKSLFKGINQVPPGHYLIATPSGISIRKYWDFNYPEQGSESNLSEQEAIEQLREHLLGSVKTRLRSDVPVGVYLSGGVDSCAVLGMASQLTDNRIDSFTLSFDDQDYDEGAIARRMAKHVNSNHHEIKITQDDIADNFVESIRYSETYCMNPHGVAKYLLSRYVRDLGFRVVLTGEGADEVFSGYSTFRNDLLKLSSKSNSPQNEQLIKKNVVTRGLEFSEIEEGLDFINARLGNVPSWIAPQMELHQKVLGFCSDAFYTPEQAITQYLNELDYNQINGRNAVHKAMYTLSKSMMPNYVLMTLGDRMEMAHSLEGRVPFLDHKVVEFVTQLPIEYKIKDMQEKYILREAVKPYIIDEVYKRQKHPFFAPPSVLDPKAKFHQLVQDTLRSDLVNDVPFFDRKMIIRFLDTINEIPQAQWASTEAILMELMSLVSLQKHFKLSA